MSLEMLVIIYGIRLGKDTSFIQRVSSDRFFMKPIKLTRIKTLCSVEISSAESSLRGHEGPVLSVDSAGHALHVFVNGKFSGNKKYDI